MSTLLVKKLFDMLAAIVAAVLFLSWVLGTGVFLGTALVVYRAYRFTGYLLGGLKLITLAPWRN